MKIKHMFANNIIRQAPSSGSKLTQSAGQRMRSHEPVTRQSSRKTYDSASHCREIVNFQQSQSLHMP